jgi:hypothetical protein
MLVEFCIATARAPSPLYRIALLAIPGSRGVSLAFALVPEKSTISDGMLNRGCSLSLAMPMKSGAGNTSFQHSNKTEDLSRYRVSFMN